MKNIYPSGKLYRHIPIIILMFFAGVFVVLFFEHVKEKSFKSFYKSKAEELELMWKTATIADQEAINSYVSSILDRKTLKLLNLAKSGREEDLMRARRELFAHLWEQYKFFKEFHNIKGLIFVLPDHRVLIRFHAPYRHGDDLSWIYPALKEVKSLKQPTHGFVILCIVAGYAYVFPVFDSNGEYLGAIILIRDSGAILKKLHSANPSWIYVVVLNRWVVEKKTLEDYRHLYQPVPGSINWVYDVYEAQYKHAIKSLGMSMGISLEKVFNNPDFLKALNSERVGAVSVDGDEIVAFAGLYETNFQIPSALLLGFSREPFLETILWTHRLYILVSLLFLEGLIVSLYVFLLRIKQSRVQARELELVSDYVSAGLIILSEGTISLANSQAHRILGYSEGEMKGKPFEEIIISYADDKELHHTECKLRKKDGSFIYAQFESKRVYIGEENVEIFTFFDITERKQKEKVLTSMSNTDMLTGLYNRRYAYSRIVEEKQKADAHQSSFSVIFADIDNFKRINDTYGHATGDIVLTEVAHKIKQCIRVEDVVARWGGEEFLILLPGVGLKGGEVLAERIRREVQGINMEGVGKITISLGVASYRAGESIDELINRADHALYTAKREGKNRVVVHV